MATNARIIANRENAQQSTGPRTEAGIDACRHNATKHGLTGKQIVIKGEDPAAYDALRSQLVADFQPVNEQEAMFVEEIAQNWWRLARARRTEKDMLDQMDLAAAMASKPFLNLQKYMARIERSYNRAQKELSGLQSLRRKEAAAAERIPPPVPREPTYEESIGSVLKFRYNKLRRNQSTVTAAAP